MKYHIAVIACIITLLAAGPSALASATVTAHVDRTSVTTGESVLLRVSIQDEDGEVDVSVIKDFKVLTRGTGSRVHMTNGQISKVFTHNYHLVPLREGRLAIPALPVRVQGRQLLTDPITIEVAARAAGGTAPAQTEVWITAEVSDTRPVQGQQITYTFRFHRSVASENSRFQPPDFQGFRAREIEDQRSFRKIINGREYAVTEVYYVLTPLQSGKLTIEPAMLQVGIVRQERRRSRSPFEDFFGRRSLEQRMLQTDAIDLHVQPLPPWQGTPSFSGLVGRFELTADMESTDLSVGDSATLALNLSGRGNIMDAQAPALQFPSTLKHYADNPEAEIKLDATGHSGKKIFRTALVPVAAGEIRIEPVRVVYFDVDEKRYKTLSAAIPTLSVTAGDGPDSPETAAAPGPLALAKQRVAFTGRDILPPIESLAAIRSKSPCSIWLFLLAVAAPALVYGAATLTLKFRQQEKTPMAVMRAKARQALKSAAGHTGDARLGHLYQALTAAILAAAGRTGEALTWKEAEALLVRNGRSRDEARKAAELLSKIESGKFTATCMDETEQAALLDQTRKMIRLLAS